MSDIQDIANEFHKRSYKVKTFRKILSNRINEIFSMDLVEMNDFLDENNGYKYILTCVDVYSRYAWAIPMKSKTGIETTKAIDRFSCRRNRSRPHGLHLITTLKYGFKLSYNTSILKVK